jgi:hypothetical protein
MNVSPNQKAIYRGTSIIHMKSYRRKALFDEQNVPPGGVCLSSFVIVRSGNRVLVGKMAQPDVWIRRFFVGEKFAHGYFSSNKYMLPARHLAWYESPRTAAEGVLRDQVRIKVPDSKVNLVEVQSHIRGDVHSKEEPPHWDICFIYEVKVPARTAKEIKSLPWFKDLHFIPLSSLATADFTRAHGDILQEAGLIK